MFKRVVLFLVIVIGGALLAAAAQSAPRSGYAPGTIVVKTGERRLYYTTHEGRTISFPVGVGKKGWSWHGRATIEAKYLSPAWSAPPELWHHPGPAPVIPGGSPRNPMGVAALVMRNGEYAIHGTNNPGSIGGFVSYGCIRMYNRDIRELYRMVDIGTPVIVER